MLEYKAYDLISYPVITEKYSLLNKYGTYIFKVRKDSNKISLKLAVEKLFKVSVKKIRIVNVKGKFKMFKGRKGFCSGFKKAFVTLNEGNVIDLYGNK